MIELFVGQVIPWAITLFLSLSVVIVLLYIPTLTKSFWNTPWIVKILLLTIVALGTFIRFYWVPNTHRIYFDEDRYLSYAVSFAKFGKATSLEYATTTKVLRGTPDKAIRTTIPVINAWVFKIAGYSEDALFITAKIFSCLQILLIFILAILLFKNYTAALFSALGGALLPGPVFWSTSIGLDSYFVFFALLALIATIVYARKITLINAVFLISSLFLLLCVRIESFLFLPLFAFTFFIVRKEQNHKIITQKDLPYIGIATLIIGVRALASLSVLGQQWCCADALPLEAFYPNYFIRNLLPNTLHLFTRREFPFLITILALITLIRMENKKVLMLGLWIVGYFILYSTYYAGMFYTEEFSGSYGRYFLIFIPPFLMLAGLELDHLYKLIKKNPIKKRLFIIFFSLLAILYFLQPTIRSYRQLIYISPYFFPVDAGPVNTHTYVETYMSKNIPKGSIVLTSMSAYFAMKGYETGLAAYFLQDDSFRDYIVAKLRSGKRVFSSFPAECYGNTEPDCEKLAKVVDYVPVKTKTPPPENNYFAEIKLKK